MKDWQEDLLEVASATHSEQELFGKIEAAARSLGFEHCAYGLRVPFPLSNPKTIILTNYPAAWQARYTQAGYVDSDPTVLHGRRTQVPLIWADSVFESAADLWDEARAFGLGVGWVQSSLDGNGVGGMLTLARAKDPLSSTELASEEVKMRWLVNVSHMSMSRILAPRLGWHQRSSLTEREVEVLKWTADGKTASEISDILTVSEHTVIFHVKNAVSKMQSANKTAAVVRAAMMGLLN